MERSREKWRSTTRGRRRTRVVVGLMGAAVAVLLSVPRAEAMSNYLSTVWPALYPKSTADDNAGCQLCHASSTQNLNPYGHAICTGSGDISARILAAEDLDSDADPSGATNREEIDANTQPGWTPGDVNATYSRSDCSPTGNTEAPPSFIPDPLDPPPAATCGDGIVDPGEECDGGPCCAAACTFAAAGTACDDGDFCTEGDVCDGAGACSPGGPRNCSDGVGCTVDTCDSANATCVHTPDDSACADDGVFCNGQEICDPVNDCTSTGNPCEVGTVCNDATDTCDPQAACGNGVVEPGEECDGGACCAADCTFAVAGAACDDGDFCTTGDACDGAGSCLAGGPTDCSDGVGCTVDTCDSANAACVHTPDDAFCDNGTFCDGVEICDPTNDCTSPGDPCPPGTMCDEATAACAPIAGCGDGILQSGEECDDGNTVDGDCCSADCQFEAAGSLCDDGQFCTVGELCDGAGVCGGGQPLDCSDGVACTDDICDEANATCVHTPNDAHCADDGQFCTGLEYCDATNDCSSTGDPCGVGTTCNEATDTCDPSAVIVDLDIVRLKVTKRGRVGRRIRIKVAVQNHGDSEGARPATVVGVQDGTEVYHETLEVSDPVGDGATAVRFPPYVPAAPGVISWTATIADDDPDVDAATTETRVVERRGHDATPAGVDEHSGDGGDDDHR